VARDFIPSLPQRKTPKMSSPDFKPSPSTHYITIADRPAQDALLHQKKLANLAASILFYLLAKT
jgi:hypothetical protein